MVLPFVIQIPDNGGRFGRGFVHEGVRVGFIHPVHVVAGLDVVFVDASFAYSGNETLPDARVATRPQGVGGLVPAVKVADDGYPFRVRRPDRKIGSFHPFACQEVCSQFVVQPKVRAFVEQVNVMVRQQAEVIVHFWGARSWRRFAALLRHQCAHAVLLYLRLLDTRATDYLLLLVCHFNGRQGDKATRR